MKQTFDIWLAKGKDPDYRMYTNSYLQKPMIKRETYDGIERISYIGNIAYIGGLKIDVKEGECVKARVTIETIEDDKEV